MGETETHVVSIRETSARRTAIRPQVCCEACVGRPGSRTQATFRQILPEPMLIIPQIA